MNVVKIIGLGAGLALVAYLFGAFCAASLNLAEWPVAGRGWTASLWLIATLVLVAYLRSEGDL